MRGATASFFLKIGSTTAALLTSVLLVRIMGAVQFGYFTYSVSLVSLLTVPTSLGLPNLLIRFLAAYRAEGRWGLMHGLLVRTNQAVLAVSVVVALLALAVIWPQRNALPALDPPTFLVSLLLLPLAALNALRGASLRGLHHVVLGQLPEDLVRPAMLIVLVLVVWLLTSVELGATTVVWLQVAATLTAFGVGWLLLLGRIPQEVRRAPRETELRIWFRAALPLLALGGMQIVNQRTDIVILGIFEGPAQVGIYQVVGRGSSLVGFALMAVNTAVAPEFARLFAQGRMERLQRIVTVSTRAILAFTVPTAAAMVFLGRWALETIFGPGFGAGAPALTILSLAQIVNAGMGSVGFLLNMTGHEADSAKGFLVGAVLNIVLNLVLVPRFGMVGAAVATASSMAVWNVLLGFWVYKRLRIYPSIFAPGHARGR